MSLGALDGFVGVDPLRRAQSSFFMESTVWWRDRMRCDNLLISMSLWIVERNDVPEALWWCWSPWRLSMEIPLCRPFNTCP